MERIPGPDFPTGAQIVGRRGIEDAQRTGRGLITMRAVVEVDRGQPRPHDAGGHGAALPGEPGQPAGQDRGAAQAGQDVGDRRHHRPVQRRHAAAGDHPEPRTPSPKVVLNQLYKHTQLRETFGANMVALVDGVPGRCPWTRSCRHWITHQITVIRRRTTHRLRVAEERAHILRGLLAAIDRIDEVIALIRGVGVGGGGPGRPDGAAGHRRGPGPGDPRHAAAPAGGAGAPGAAVALRRAHARHRRVQRPSWPATSGSAGSSARSWPRSSPSSATSGAPGSSPTRAT